MMLLLRLLVDDGKHACLERLLVLKQTHLLPLVVEHLGVHIVALHAFVEEADAMAVIRLGIELKAAAVFHILFELERAAAAKVVKRCLELLLLDILILFILVFAG